MSSTVSCEIKAGIALITIDNPPVNALSHAVRSELVQALEHAEQQACAAMVLHCAGRTFIAGADIREFGQPPADPRLPQVVNRLEACAVPVVAALHGTALGGGLETAMGCHYRIAAASTKLGLPEVTLGILPGAGGTQRTPRLMGVRAALDLMVSGRPINAQEAQQAGLIDRIAEGELLPAALAWARELIAEGKAPRRASELPVSIAGLPHDFFNEYRGVVSRKHRGLPAPLRIIDCVEKATQTDFASACQFEREKFTELVRSPESAGLRHAFFAEREAARVEALPADTPLRTITTVGIVGAGTMGGGIAMCCATAGFPVTLLELSTEALERGLSLCRRNFERSVASGRYTAEQVEIFMSRIRGTSSYADLNTAELVIEAVFEDPQVKKAVFRQLDASCKPGAILASNTSYQDIDEIAAVTARPGDVLGMHFFSPANVMKLLEVVRGGKTSDEALATVMKFARTISKVPVLARVCYGFIGNRMLRGYFREAQMLLLEGLSPAQVDRAMESFGMAMGPLAVGDLAGLDVGYRARKAIAGLPDHPSVHVADQLVEMGRCGQKSGAGYYRYDPVTRKRTDDQEVAALIRSEATRLGIEPRQFSDQEIIERLVYPLINEGAQILQDGIAQRPGDIDIVYVYGYGFPRHRGGPMFYADTIGPAAVYQRICEFRDTSQRPQDWQPSFLLESLAKAGSTLASMPARQQSPR